MLTIKLKIQNSKICEVLCMAIVVGSRQKVGLLHKSATVNFDDSCFHFNAVKLKACAQRFRYALFAFIHTQTYFEYYTLTLRLASLVKKAVIYAYWTKELFDICRENVSHMATLPSVARHVIHADNLGTRH